VGKLTLPFLLLTSLVCVGCEESEPAPGYAATAMSRPRMLEHHPRPYQPPYHEQPALPVRRRDPFAQEAKDLDDDDPLFLLGMALVVGLASVATGVKRSLRVARHAATMVIVSLLLGLICALILAIALPLVATSLLTTLLLKASARADDYSSRCYWMAKDILNLLHPFLAPPANLLLLIPRTAFDLSRNLLFRMLYPF
jgi:hypothetical protein